MFSRLDVPGIDLRSLPWLVPEPFESIGAYSGRMGKVIEGDRPVLLGVSFGGMIAIEIAKKIPGARVIIISSVRHRHQLPLWIRLGGRIYPRRMGPILRGPRWSFRFAENYFMGVESDEDRKLVAAFQNKIDQRFLHWAIHVIATWRNEWTPASFYHIHGDRDHLFPIRKVQPTHAIPDGGHLMVFNRAEAVSGALRDILAGVL